VHDRRRLAVRMAVDLPVDVVAVADVEHPLVVGLRGWVALRHLCLPVRFLTALLY
jgi:hypothetical protein